jgi:hypothetical protein
MLERFIVVLGQVVTLFLMMGVGFVLAKLKLITAAGTKEMTNLLIDVVTPCVIINAFQIDWDAQMLRTMGVGTLAMLGTYLLVMVLLPLFFRKEEPGLRATLRFGTLYGNVGFMGVPLVSAVLGGSTVIYAVLAIAVFNVTVFSHGAILMGGREAFSPKQIINPGLVALLIGLALFFTRTTLPGPLYTAVSSISNMNTPLAMAIIGAQLSRADIARTFRDPKLYAAAALKQIGVPLLTAVALLPLKLDATFYIAAVILAGAPAAGFTSIFAEKYDRDVGRAAQLVSLSTLLSVLTLPAVAVLAEALAR